MSQQPANLDAERSLIGAILLDNFQRVHTSDVKAYHFYHDAHRVMYGALVAMIDDRKPTDFLTLADALQAIGQLEYVGGLGYLSDIVGAVPSASMAKRYAEIVLDRAIDRGLLGAAEDIRAIASATDGKTSAEKQAEAIKVLSVVAETSGGGIEIISTADAISAAVKQTMDRIDREPGVIGGLPFGVRRLDIETDGMGKGELVVIGGRTSMGKSVMAMQSAIACAKTGAKSAYFSFEMPAASLALRAACSLGGVSLKSVKSGRMTDDEYHRYVTGSTLFADMPISIIDRSGLSVGQIAATCRRLKYRQGLDAIFIDHLHLMPVQANNKAAALGDISAGFQRLARELDLPVILLAQLNREAAKGNRDGKASPPVLTDLRDSGSIEQDADTVILIHRAGYYDPSSNPHEAELIVAKARNGERQSIYCGWNGPYQRFEDSPADWSPGMQQQSSNGWEV